MPEDLSSLMVEDAGKGTAIHAPTDADLASIASLANEQLRLEREVLQQELQLKLTKEALAKVKEFSLPEALGAIGMSSFQLTDGSKISVKEEVYAAITEENQEPAFEWLEATGNDGIIKNEVKLPFGKGQDEEAKQLIDLLTSRGFSFTNTRSVHWQTLRAFIKAQLSDGLPIPMETFSVHIKKVAAITTTKERK